MKSWLENHSVQFQTVTGRAPMMARPGRRGVNQPRSQLQESYDRGRMEGENALSERLMQQRARDHELMQGS